MPNKEEKNLRPYNLIAVNKKNLYLLLYGLIIVVVYKINKNFKMWQNPAICKLLNYFWEYENIRIIPEKMYWEIYRFFYLITDYFRLLLRFLSANALLWFTKKYFFIDEDIITENARYLYYSSIIPVIVLAFWTLISLPAILTGGSNGMLPILNFDDYLPIVALVTISIIIQNILFVIIEKYTSKKISNIFGILIIIACIIIF